MANVNEKSLLTSAMPSVYVRKIILEPGPSISTKRSTVVDKSRPVRKRRTKSGPLRYQATPMTKGVYNKQAGSLQTRLEVAVKDVVLKGKNNQSWLFDDSQAKLIKLKAIQSTNLKLTKYLTRSNYFNKCMVKIPQRFTEFIDYEIKEMTLVPEGAARGKLSESFLTGTPNHIAGIYRNFTFNAPTSNPKHLTYFVVCEFHSDTNDLQQDTIHGPVVVERVISASSLVEESFIFKDANGSIWGGPVHYTKATGWMEGAFHGPHEHGSLTRERLPNLKVQDLRIFDEVAKLPITLAPNRATNMAKTDYLSDLYLTRDKDGNSLLLFHFNHLNYMIDRSKFGPLLKTSSSGVQQRILSLSPILNIEIFRRRVTLREGLNRLQSSAELKYEFNQMDPDPEAIVASTADRQRQLQSRSKYTATGEYYNRFTVLPTGQNPPAGYKFFGKIEEVAAYQETGLRTFSVVDADMAGITDGVYQYGVRIKVQDGTAAFLKRNMTELSRSAEMLEAYFASSERPAHFQRTLQRFTETFWRLYTNRGGRIVEPWLGAIVKYIEVLDLATNISGDQKYKLSKALYSVISPYTGRPSGILRFIEMVRVLETQVFQITNIAKESHAKDRSAISQTTINRTIDLEHQFPETFDSNVLKNTGFDYFGVNTTDVGILQLRAGTFKTRVDTELNRYAKTTFTAEEAVEASKSLSPTDVEVLAADGEKYTHIAPAYLEVSNTKINLLSANIDPLDYVTATAVVDSILKNPAARSVSVPASAPALGLMAMASQGASLERLTSLNSLAVENARSMGIEIDTIPELAEEAETQSELPSGDYLGGASPFAVATAAEPTVTVKQVSEDQDILAVASILGQSELSSSPNASKTPISFDLTRDDNFINRRIRPNLQMEGVVQAKGSMTAALQALPKQIRMLTLNKENLYGDEEDAQTNGFIYNFAMLRAVEYLSGYTGRSLKRPVWKLITSSVLDNIKVPLICRINRYNNPATNVGGYDKLDQLPVYNEFFLLAPEASGVSPALVKPIISGAKISSATRSRPGGFIRSSLLRSPAKEIAQELFRYENAQRSLGLQTDYALTRVPKAPANKFGSTAGVQQKATSKASPKSSTPRRRGRRGNKQMAKGSY